MQRNKYLYDAAALKDEAAAQKLWDEFNQKLAYIQQDISPGTPPKKKSYYQKKLSENEAKEYMDELASKSRQVVVQAESDPYPYSPDFEKKANQAATKIQRFLRSRRQIPVNLNGNHDSEFLHLVNGQKIKRFSNNGIMQEIKKALDNGDWENEIFKIKHIREHLREYALSLYAAKKITPQQMFTILDREQTFAIYPNQKTYKILDENKQFTKEALTSLLPTLINRNLQKPFNDEQIESFRLLIATLPPSEQIFYTVEHIEGKGSNYLRETLVSLEAILINNNHTLRLSCGARDALGLIQFGSENYARLLPRFGRQSIDDIEVHVRNKTRPGATAYPGTIPFTDIHNDTLANIMEAFDHDYYHSIVMSTLCEYLPNVFPYLIDLSRANIDLSGNPLNWSREIWTWVDGDYPYFYYNQKSLESPTSLTLQQSTNYFCEWLNLRDDEYSGAFIVKKSGWGWESGDLTPLGVLILMDMFENKEKWKQQFRIDPDDLTGIIKNSYETIQSIYLHLRDNDLKIRILKYSIYQSLQRHHLEYRFSAISKMIDDHEKAILESLDLKKVGKKDIDNFENGVQGFRINTLYLTYKNIDVVQSGLIFKLLKDIHKLENPDALSENQRRFADAVLYRDFDKNEAEAFSKLTNKSKKEAEFDVKPTLKNWIGCHKLSSFLAVVSIVGIAPLYFYAKSQVKIQGQQNAKKTTMTHTFFHSFSVNSEADGTLKNNKNLTRGVSSRSS